MTANLTPISDTEICDQLAQALRAYQGFTSDLEDYRAKAAQANADQEAALASDGSEDEVASKIAKSEAMKSVYAVRTKHKEEQQARLITELEKLYPSASREFSGRLGAETDKRRALIIAKVTEALEIASDLAAFEAISCPAAITSLTQYSEPIRAISRLRPNMYWGTPGDGVAIAACASALLADLKQFNELTAL
jgi:hypothetical protein